MTEALQTRTEHSRSLEDAEKYRALETLQEVGLLIPLSEVESFHGRVGGGREDEWTIDPAFANGSNDSGNYNVNSRPTLYTGEKEVATQFARERTAELARPQYNEYFRQQVRDATDTEKESLVALLNQAEHQQWETWRSNPSVITPEQPKQYAIADLNDPNVHRRAAHLLELDTQQEIKNELWQGITSKLRAEIHDIVAGDSDAMVLDLNFNPDQLSEVDTERYKKALVSLLLPVTEGSPVAFDHRDVLPQYVDAMQEREGRGVVHTAEVAEIAHRAGIDEDLVLQLVSGFNARLVAAIRPSYLASKLIGSADDIVVDKVSVSAAGEQQEVPLNLEYAQRYFRSAHIVGVSQSINSATLARNITSVSLFDLEKVTTDAGLAAERTNTQARLGAIAASLGELLRPEVNTTHELLRLLEDPHAKPANLLAEARKVEGFEEIFAADTGNWEGFTLAEHTETVLRNFDENYADTIPVELIGPMRLAIIAHDLGKPVAAAERQKHAQQEFNMRYAREFFDKLGIDKRLSTLLSAVLGEGEEHSFQINIRKVGKPADRAMQTFATNVLQEVYGKEVTPEQVNGFIEMCSMLQLCDGGAYTSMAVTRKEGGVRYRNAPSFNDSFAQPVGFGKRGIRLREVGAQGASPDLTPKDSNAPKSRVRVSRRGSGHKTPVITG